ncbi:glycosyltransferase [Wenxinia marina]|uniref:Glycosyltransferase n=1 Tax=Wenxinia marina DSM 24838 TaxID=1123501 RepID=A0A0D0Q5K6_9RHOB|nr:glycosyltransferase [Wenxinia marina]KIQ67772.1 Glycosyltransferase [Wenxinia marina DSM 24838]GGL77371.1 glycosyl transferase [Wenxinia marina]
MKIAIVHYWLVGMRGGEKVVEQIATLFPDADIFTHVCDRDRISDTLRRHRIVETSIARLPGARRHYPKYLGFMPRALEELDLRAYDLVISSESGPAKGVITRPDAVHVCYVHSPMRYLWDMSPDYAAGFGGAGRVVFAHVAHRLRQWDVTSAQRVDHLVANSRFVARRIEKFWRRASTVIHPPVDLDAFRPTADPDRAGYLFVSELVPYKRADLAIDAFRQLRDRRLVIVGDGPDLSRLRAAASANVSFRGRVGAEELTQLYQNCRALIFPAEEDFGIVPLEAMACGRPVIAYGRGGALDSVREGETGTFFDAQTPDSLVGAVRRFEADLEARLSVERIAARAARFGEGAFRAAFGAYLAERVPGLASPIAPLPELATVAGGRR